MVQASSGAGDPAQRAIAPLERGGAGSRARALPRVQALIEKGRDRGAARNTSWWERLLESLRALTRPPILRHAIAALERGNLDAAFALLREEVKARPGQAESALLFWNAAVSVERAPDAAEAMARLVRSLAAADDGLEQAANHWTALVTAVPEAVVDVPTLAKLVPLLRARSEQARGEVAKIEAQTRFVDALRRCVDPAHGPLNPALALRLVEESRGVDAHVASTAAQVALTSSSLHEAKRSKLEELVASLARGEWPDRKEADASRPTRSEPQASEGRQPERERIASAKARPGQEADASRPTRASAEGARSEPKASEGGPPQRLAKPNEGRQPERARITSAKARQGETAESPRAPAPRAAKPRPAVPPEEKPAPGGRRSVALTQDEIEAASTRLAERMAGRPAAAAQPEVLESLAPPPAPGAEEPVLDARDVLEVDDEPQDKDEPIAILEQDDAVAILEVDDDDVATAILEEDAQVESIESVEPLAVLEETDPGLDDANAEFEFGGAAAAATGPGGALESADATLDEVDAQSDDFAFGAEPEDEASDADFEIGSEAGLGEETDPLGATIAGATFAQAPPAEAEAPGEEVPSAAAPAPALRAIDILPVEIGADGFVAYEIAQAQRTRVDYRAVEAIAAAEVTGLGDEPILVALLVLRARPGRPRSALRMRCDTFDPASLFPDRTDAGQALRAMLSDLLERTRAIPLPDPDSALAVQPQQFDSFAAFEEAVLARLPV